MRACLCFLLSLLTLFAPPARSTYYYPRLVHPELIDPGVIQDWCDQQVQNCPLLCQAAQYYDNYRNNSCDPVALTFNCDCPDPDIHAADYKNTFPWFVCQHNRQTLCKPGNTDINKCLSENRCGTKEIPNAIAMSGLKTGDFEPSPPVLPTSNEGFGIPTSSPQNDGGQAPAPTSVDLTFLSTATSEAIATHQTTSQATTGASVDSVATATATPSRSNSGGGLSVGAKAGIAVGAIVGFAIIALLALFFLRKKRKQKQQAPLLSDEGKNLGAGPSTMSHQDPYSDSPAHAANPNRFSWAPPPPVIAEVPPVQQPYGDQAYGGPQSATRDIANEEAAAGYWQQSAGQSPVSPQTRHSDLTAPPRTSLQEARAPPSPVHQSPYTAYAPSPQSATAAPTQRGVGDDWDEDERRLEAEIAEIDRMRQVREERAAMR